MPDRATHEHGVRRDHVAAWSSIREGRAAWDEHEIKVMAGSLQGWGEGWRMVDRGQHRRERCGVVVSWKERGRAIQ